MKNLFFLLAAIMFSALITTDANAQAFQRLVQGTDADTLKASETHYTLSVNCGGRAVQAVAAHVSIDSVSGTCAGTATLQQSLDGVHWNTTGSAATWTGAAWNNAFPETSASDTCFILSLNPFLGQWARVKIVTTSSTQKAKYWVTIKSSDIR